MIDNRCDFDTLSSAIAGNSERTLVALESFFAGKRDDGSLRIIKEAQEYSLLGMGKRIRPFLVNEVCRMLGGKTEGSMPFAMAVEMIHTYSLIHDDLPCMDDDDMRRGKPSNHKVFGEATAVLAGDALLTNAFLAAAENTAIDAEATRAAIALISEAAGDGGMIGGQVLDIYGEDKEISFDELLLLHSLKTGKMIELSAALGAIAAGYREDSSEYATVCSYARKIGIVFQAVDDLLDAYGDESAMGKPILSDTENKKTTFLTFFDADGVREYAKRLNDEAINEISKLKGSEILVALAEMLLNRKS